MMLFYACGDDPSAPNGGDPPVNQAPVVEIVSPGEGDIFNEGDGIFFQGSAIDEQDGELPPDSLVWRSDKDGVLGRGTVFLWQDLSVNNHTIRLVATDSDGNSRSASVKIHVWFAVPGNIKVLFIGNSYFGYNELPIMFQTLAAAGSKTVQVGEEIVGGTRLDYHAEALETELAINSDDWNYVICIGASPPVAYPEDHQYIFPPYTYHPVVPSMITLKEKIEANCPTTHTVFCMPWAYESGNTWIEGYDDDYFDMQLLIYQNTNVFSDEVPFITAPVGWAWNRVLSEVSQLHYLHNPDESHPSVRGSYLMACVIYATFFRESPEGIEYYAGVPRIEAEYFQEVAADIVLDDLKLWNMIP